MIQLPKTPQYSSASFKNQEVNSKQNIQSLKVEKSRNFLNDEPQEISLTLIKQKPCYNELSVFDTSIRQKISPNETKILLNNDQSNLNVNHTEDALQNAQSQGCCFCKENENLIPLCRCSQAHFKCANNFLKLGPILEQLKCQKCNDFRQVNSQVYFDFSLWQQNKWHLLFETIFLLIIFTIIGVLSYFTTHLLEDSFENERILISCLVFSYTICFIVLICMISKIISHFKKISFTIKSYDPLYQKINQNYIKLMQEL
ncbi:unnamed protein product (macronuclear) [Paramecium tetraurelia]|uniref:RING-CH-type domain-containing protein n=1 Tax=Paramecium tetraurelia TaxID=5888 RepID=A0DPK1_PARTE|nr:uncharacterized protein GSPATT00019150001 [Paramecium tetraurelia]CAK84968.1 unnamed protein product [Paramecium tetraurelia]|eukprot:XP_001452365.1 hypothetical protein (macronuclear) [Paramecium tetraurelia strain d4-2]